MTLELAAMGLKIPFTNIDLARHNGLQSEGFESKTSWYFRGLFHILSKNALLEGFLPQWHKTIETMTALTSPNHNCQLGLV